MRSSRDPAAETQQQRPSSRDPAQPKTNEQIKRQDQEGMMWERAGLCRQALEWQAMSTPDLGKGSPEPASRGPGVVDGVAGGGKCDTEPLGGSGKRPWSLSAAGWGGRWWLG